VAPRPLRRRRLPPPTIIRRLGLLAPSLPFPPRLPPSQPIPRSCRLASRRQSCLLGSARTEFFFRFGWLAWGRSGGVVLRCFGVVVCWCFGCVQLVWLLGGCPPLVWAPVDSPFGLRPRLSSSRGGSRVAGWKSGVVVVGFRVRVLVFWLFGCLGFWIDFCLFRLLASLLFGVLEIGIEVLG